MKLKSALMETRDEVWEVELSQHVCSRKENFELLMDYFFSGDFHLSHRASLVILSVAKDKPDWVQEQIPKMVKTLNKELPDWYKRNILRILQFQKVPEKNWGHLVDQCFSYLASSVEPVAVKVFAMTVIYNITKNIPELAHELKILIEEQYPMGSAGFKARGRKILLKLAKDGH